MEWGTARSGAFGMTNGIRQGSILSPYLFNIYVDELNVQLSNCKLGCHVGTEASNNFSYADDLAIVAPTAKALNAMLEVCTVFASRNSIEFSPTKTVAMLISPDSYKIANKPNIHLGNSRIAYVEEFRYLGHIITCDLTDDADMERERRSLATRGNLIAHKFHSCSDDVKRKMFKCYCYNLYGCSLWSKHRKSTMDRLRVTYNKVMRRLMGLPPWCSASSMFVYYETRSFQEVVRSLTFSMYDRVAVCTNNVICNLSNSDASVKSTIRKEWFQRLFLR